MQKNTKNCFILWALFVSILLSALILRAEDTASAPEDKATVYILYTNQREGPNPKAFHIKTLTAVLGSEDAAEKALVYSYTIISGFAAALTPAQAKKMSEQPHVVQVVPSREYHIDLPSTPRF